MVRESAKMLLLGVLLSGLCLSTSANTTDDDEARISAVPNVSPTKHDAPADGAPISIPIPIVILPPSHAAAEPVRFALLLPLHSDTLGSAASAVRDGFLAAYEHDKAGVAVTVIETTDVPEEIVSSYTNTLALTDIVIGPLTRSGAAAIAESGAVRKPTISLTQSDIDTDAAAPLPPMMLAMGLSVEDEARQVAAWIASSKPAKKIVVVSTSVSWQRRAAKAFSVKGKLLGLDVETIELGSAGGYLSAADLAQLKKQILSGKPVNMFAALDAAQARQVREVIGNETAIYGTAQLNPLALSDWQTVVPMTDMNGVHLLDIPWQLQADYPAAMIYPRLVVPADQKRSADMERMYALGIDAFRVARLVMSKQKKFEVDGVTGKLIIGFDKPSGRFGRIETPAIYRDGVVVPLVNGQ